MEQDRALQEIENISKAVVLLAAIEGNPEFTAGLAKIWIGSLANLHLIMKPGAKEVIADIFLKACDNARADLDEKTGKKEADATIAKASS